MLILTRDQTNDLLSKKSISKGLKYFGSREKSDKKYFLFEVIGQIDLSVIGYSIGDDIKIGKKNGYQVFKINDIYYE